MNSITTSLFVSINNALVWLLAIKIDLRKKMIFYNNNVMYGGDGWLDPCRELGLFHES